MINDLISRQAAIDALTKAIDDVGVLDEDDYTVFRLLPLVFRLLPSVQPEPYQAERRAE